MSEQQDTVPEQIEAPLLGPGDRLRMAREALGKDLAQIATETRIPQRHLKLIEAGAFEQLPAKTYAIGFARSFAREVELDPDEIAEEVRAELAGYEPDSSRRQVAFEPGDPARIPGARISWIAGGAVVVLLVVGWFGYNSLFAPAGELPSLVSDEPAAVTAPSSAPAARAPDGEVAFTALEDGVWVKFYDAAGTQLMQKEMALGERYVVPAGATGPLLRTGRPDALAITVGGRPVPRLAESEGLVKDVPVTAAALLARPAPAPSPAPLRAGAIASSPPAAPPAPVSTPTPAASASPAT